MDVLKLRQAILDIGNKRLIGDGEVEIKLPPDSPTTPLFEAPSGHLCMVIDSYSEVLPQYGGVDSPVQPSKLPMTQSSSSRSHVQGLGAAGTPGGPSHHE